MTTNTKTKPKVETAKVPGSCVNCGRTIYVKDKIRVYFLTGTYMQVAVHKDCWHP